MEVGLQVRKHPTHRRMDKDNKILAIIPARSGSKGVPNKNIALLSDHPLLSYSIASGLASKVIDRVIVSTDSPEYRAIALKYGAEVPFMRPTQFAQDDSTDLPVMVHALDALKSAENWIPDFVVQLRPTSFLRPKGFIDKAISIITNSGDLECVRSVTESKPTPYKMWKMVGQSGTMEPLLQSDINEPYNMPRQLLPKTWAQTGHIDVIRSETILRKNSLTGQKIAPCFIEAKYCIDIDNTEDLDYAEWVLKNRKLEIDWPCT